MTNAGCDERVASFLAKRAVSNPRSSAYYKELWDGHRSAGLINKHFVSEFTSGSMPKFFQRAWEMLLARHLRACKHTITSRPEGEPDFRFERNGVVVWVEAVSPEPGEELSSISPSSVSVPHEQTLLRWTTAFDAKWQKGIDYRRKGIIKTADAYVIAIDGSQLGRIPLPHGASRMPYIVEAVFAMGPLAFEFDKASGRFLGTTATVRFLTQNRNNAPVRTEPFFNQQYENVSAIIGCVPPMFSEPLLPIQVAYNPLAAVSLNQGIFGASAEEWSASLVSTDSNGSDWDLKKL